MELNLPPGHDPELIFRLRTTRSPSGLTIYVEGRLDGRAGDHLVDVAEQFTRAGDEVVLDLTFLSGMDRDGAGAIVRSARAIKALGATPSVTVSDGRFERLLRPYRLTQRADVSISGAAVPAAPSLRRPQ